MLNLPGEVHFWTSKDDICIPETDFGAFRYHEKKEAATESLYLESKKSYACGRGITWAVSNKRSSTVKKEALRDFEEQLTAHRVVRCEWRRHDALQLLLSSGLLVTIRVNLGTGDIVKITSDKYLFGKLPSECLTDVVYGQSHVLLAFSDAVLGMVHLGRPHTPAPDKLARQEAKFLTFDLGGPSGRRLERKLSLSADETMVLAWWRCAQDEVYPWSPIVRDCDRANLLVYSIAGQRLELLCFYKTEGDPISVMFSRQHSNVILLVEQRVSRKGEVSVESSTFEVAAGGRLLRSPTVGALQLQTQACCVARSPDETRLALGCIDGSVLLHSPSSTLLAKAAFIPSLVAWHPDGSLVVVANEKGQLQSFDLALAPVRIQLLSEETVCTASLLDLTSYFRYQPTLSYMAFNKKPVLEEFSDPYAPSDGYLLMQFERGPLAVLRLVGGGGLPGSLTGFSPDTLVSQYLRLDLVDCAINLLGTLSWDTQGAICLACMHRVCNHLLALPLSTTVEEQLEAALGTFMSPSVPLSLAAERQFGRTMHHLARRFFHQLLRYQRFEKSFRLAIDLGDHDLFMDLFHSARGVGDETLAQAARQKASEVDEGDTGSSSSACECSRSSCSECGSASSSASSDSDSYPDPAALMAKPTKVTFSDTVTHIVEVSSGEDEDGDDEDDEVQALIVSDAPHLPSRPAHTRSDPHVPQSSVPQYTSVPRSSSHSELLIANSMSISSFSAGKIPINMALYTSSSSYLAHLPGTLNPAHYNVETGPLNPAHYSVETGTGFTAISYASTPALASTNQMSRNSELRSSLSSMVPPPKVHQASITSCNKLTVQAKNVPQTERFHNVSRTYMSNALRNEGHTSPAPRNGAQLRKDGSAPVSASPRSLAQISRNEGIANTSLRNDAHTHPSLRNDGSSHMSPSLRNDMSPSLRNDGSSHMSPSLRNDGSSYTSPSLRNDALMSPSLRNDALMSPSLRNDAHMSPSLRNDALMSPSLRNDALMSPSLRNDAHMSPSLRNEALMSPSLRNDSSSHTSPSLRNDAPMSPSLRNDAHMSPSLRNDSSSHTSPSLRNDAHMSPSLRNDSSSHTSPSLRNDSSSHTSPSLRNDSSSHTSPSLRNDARMNSSLRNENPVYTSRNESVANMPLKTDGPSIMSPSLRNENPVYTSRNESVANMPPRTDGPSIMSPSMRSSAHMSPSTKIDSLTHISSNNGPTSMNPSLRGESASRNEDVALRNNGSSQTSTRNAVEMSLRNEGRTNRIDSPACTSRTDNPAHTSRTDNPACTSRTDNPAHTSKNDGYTRRSDNPAHTSDTSGTDNPHRAATSKPCLPLLDAGPRCKATPPLTLSDSRNENGLPLLSLNSSPLYLSPFPASSNQRDLPLFKISSVDLRSRPVSQTSEDVQLIGDPHTSGLPTSLRDKVVLRKLGTETEEEESVTNIKVVHFGVV